MLRSEQSKIKSLFKHLSTESYICEDDIDHIIDDICKDNLEYKQYILQYVHYKIKDKKYVFVLNRRRLTNNNFKKLLIQPKQKIITVDVHQNVSIDMTNEDIDDEITDDIIIMQNKFDELRLIKLPEQRSEEWFKMREQAITASDGASAVDDHKYEKLHNFILKKCGIVSFIVNSNCYHGTKYEQIATMIYERKMNVKVEDFGLLRHPSIPFIAASPDGICGKYKFDGIHLSNKVGRMLEIKCPVTREILTEGEIIDGICPKYYWIQIQQQLECCDLEECDFWQCKIIEYSSKSEFITDTDPFFPYKSKKYGFEKGCVIQLLPKNKINEASRKYNITVYEFSKFIYPPSITMSPSDIELWISSQTPPDDYYIDKILYWRLEKSHNITIKRDKKWFELAYPKYKKSWDYILFFRNNPIELDLLHRYIKCTTGEKDIRRVIDILYNKYNKDKIIEKINEYETVSQIEDNTESEYMFRN